MRSKLGHLMIYLVLMKTHYIHLLVQMGTWKTSKYKENIIQIILVTTEKSSFINISSIYLPNLPAIRPWDFEEKRQV
jgi:hypothetical protein